MDIVVSFTRKRKNFGKHCYFSDRPAEMIADITPNHSLMEEYPLPIFIHFLFLLIQIHFLPFFGQFLFFFSFYFFSIFILNGKKDT